MQPYCGNHPKASTRQGSTDLEDKGIVVIRVGAGGGSGSVSSVRPRTSTPAFFLVVMEDNTIAVFQPLSDCIGRAEDDGSANGFGGQRPVGQIPEVGLPQLRGELMEEQGHL